MVAKSYTIMVNHCTREEILQYGSIHLPYSSKLTSVVQAGNRNISWSEGNIRPRWGFLYFKNRKSNNILQIKYQILVLEHIQT